jgi:phage terminase small subunit
MAPLRNARQEKFCEEYVRSGNGTRSYEAAGYKCRTENCAAAGAVQILRNIHVKARLRELQNRTAARVEEALGVDREWVVRRLVENVERAMQGVPVCDRNGKPTGEWKYEGNVVNRGLELIGKHLGMFVEPEKAPPTHHIASVSFYLPHNGRDPMLAEQDAIAKEDDLPVMGNRKG